MTHTLEALKKERPFDPFPQRIIPIQPTEARRIPRNADQWLAQFHFEGTRILFIVRDRRVAMKQIREGNLEEITGIFDEIEMPFYNFTDDIILDGQLVYGRGKTEFNRHLLEKRITNPTEERDSLKAQFIVNDMLYQENLDLRKVPFQERQERVAKLIEPSISSNYGIYPNTPNEDILATISAAGENGYRQVSFRKKEGLYMPGQNSWRIYTLPA